MYRSILDGVVLVGSSLLVSEIEKILKNTFRNVNIALANEMIVACKRMEIDIWEVIDDVKIKPLVFMPFYPGPGLGGHCGSCLDKIDLESLNSMHKSILKTTIERREYFEAGAS